jgi:DNA-binding transcriptional regulator GbsR (MarR family)
MNGALGGIYNPQAMPEGEFLARYSVRLALTQKLLKAILATGPEDDPQHFVIQGQRGQGKTSLLRRVYLALRDSAETRDWLLPVLFKEELYGVTGLCRLWEETAGLLADDAGFAHLTDAFEAAWETPHYEKDCFLLLDEALRKADVRLVLLVDNLGDLFGKLHIREQQRLREILHTSNRIQIIGASTVMLEQHYDHSAPFYQFFREINRPGLDREEALTLLRHLGTEAQQARLEQVIAQHPGRIETLRRLTAGVPRTLVLLFEILLDADGGAFRDLELLLDRVTPLYKHRMDDLPAQQQAVVDAVALGWDALSTKEIARATRLPSKQVSAQLKSLERANIIHREPTSTKNHLYRLEERFFNIWYLMRHARARDRRRALWLVRFLEAWCTPEDLRERAERHIQMLTEQCFQSEHAWLMTEALRGAGLDEATEDRLVKATRDYLPLEFQDRVTFSVREQRGLLGAALKKDWQLFQKALHGNARIAATEHEELRSFVANSADVRNPELAELRQLGMLRLVVIGGIISILADEIDEAEALFRDACERGSIDAHYLLSRVLFLAGRNREEALEIALASPAEKPKLLSFPELLWQAMMQVWNQDFPNAFQTLERAFALTDVDKEHLVVTESISLLLAADQTAYVRRLFEDEQFAEYRLRDRFKPFYYALLAQLGESRADDFKRMGPELAETVEEIRLKVAHWREKYFGPGQADG